MQVCGDALPRECHYKEVFDITDASLQVAVTGIDRRIGYPWTKISDINIEGDFATTACTPYTSFYPNIHLTTSDAIGKGKLGELDAWMGGNGDCFLKHTGEPGVFDLECRRGTQTRLFQNEMRVNVINPNGLDTVVATISSFLQTHDGYAVEFELPSQTSSSNLYDFTRGHFNLTPRKSPGIPP